MVSISWEKSPIIPKHEILLEALFWKEFPYVGPPFWVALSRIMEILLGPVDKPMINPISLPETNSSHLKMDGCEY